MTEGKENVNMKDTGLSKKEDLSTGSPKKVSPSVDTEEASKIYSKINNTKKGNLGSSMAKMGGNTLKNATAGLMDEMASGDDEESTTFRNASNNVSGGVDTFKKGRELLKGEKNQNGLEKNNKLKNKKKSNSKDNENKVIKKGKSKADKVKSTKSLKNKKGIKAFFSGKGKVFKIIGSIFGSTLILEIILIILVAIVFAMVVQNLMIKFGLTGSDSDEIFSEKYEETLSREEIDDIFDESVSDPCGPVSWFNKLKHFVGIYDLTKNQDLCLYIRKSLEKKESLPGISNLGPGYFFSAFYYAYDTQNIDKDGHMFIEVEQPESDDENDIVMATDLDAVATLFETGIYKKEDIDTLLDNYILEYNFKQEGVHYYQWVIDEDTGEGTCKKFDDYKYNEISETKFQAYLRFGENVANSFQRDSNLVKAYGMTSGECLEQLETDLGPKPSLVKYSTKMDLNSNSQEIPTIVISNPFYPMYDGTYTYQNGFIYKTYPKFKPEYTFDNIVVPFDFKVCRRIEEIMEYIYSRQDYTNSVLGYPNNVLISTNTGSATSCVYTVNGSDLTGVKVKLVHAKNSAVPGVNTGDEIEGQELVDLEKYVLGVVYAEHGSAPEEALKVQAIAARNYILNRGHLMEEDGQKILRITNSTYDQTYCDPDEGCDRCIGKRGVVSLYKSGTTPAGSTCVSVSPLPNDSYVRKAVKSVSGVILQDAEGNTMNTPYTGENQLAWSEMANQGKDYIEILRSTYGESSLSNPSCTFASGDWDSWRQGGEEWGNKSVGSSTMSQIGCFITAHAKALAASGAQLKVNNFNPGVFIDIINANHCLSGNNLDATCALNAVLANGYVRDRDRTSVSLTGSIEQKASIISNYLNQGYQVILRVKAEPDQHWVYVTGVNGSTIYISDTSSNANTVIPKYSNSGVVYMIGYKFR